MEIIDFQTGHFADLVQFKIDSHFATLDKSKLTLIIFKDFGHHSDFAKFGQNIASGKTVQMFCLTKIQEPHIGFGTSNFHQFSQWESRTGFPC